MRILFLDIDGVLNHHMTPHRHDGTHLIHMDQEKVFMLNRAQDRSGFQVVLSSSWRHGNDWRGAMRANGIIFGFLDRTPLSVPWPLTSYAGGRRGSEIKTWLDTHPSPDAISYAILDDENDMLPEQQSHFFKTSGWFGQGLTQDLMDQVEAHLNA